MFLEPPFKAWEEPEQDREPALAEQLGQLVRAAHGAFSDSTERALRSDLAIYAEWCAERGERPLPAKPETIAAFVDAKAELRAPATVRRYVTSIGIAQRALGLEKTVKSPPVQLALKRMHRKKGRRQNQATGLTWPLRQRLLDAAGDRLQSTSATAPCSPSPTTRCCAARSSYPCKSPIWLRKLRGDASLLVRRSKTDCEGHGRDRVGRSGHRRAGAHVARSRRDIEDGMLFRSVGKGARVGERLHPCQVPRIFKAMAREAGLPEDGGWRACRATAPGSGRRRTWSPPASSCRRSSMPGRWKSTAMVNRYGERLLAKRSGAAQLGTDAGAGLSRAGRVYGCGRRAMMSRLREQAVTACIRRAENWARAHLDGSQLRKMLSSVIIGGSGGPGSLPAWPGQGRPIPENPL